MKNTKSAELSDRIKELEAELALLRLQKETFDANYADDVNKIVAVLREEYAIASNREVFGVLRGDSPMLRPQDIEVWKAKSARLLKLVGGDYKRALVALSRWGHLR